MTRRWPYEHRPLKERIWDLPGLAWLSDDPLTATLAYLLIAAALSALGLVIFIAVSPRPR